MYGNTPFADEDAALELSSDERRHLRRDLASVAARTRELLPSEFVVGSEIADGQNGPRATVAVQPPIGGIVSADYTPGDSSVRIDEDERDEHRERRERRDDGAGGEELRTLGEES